MTRLLYVLGALLIVWGFYVLLTGDFVATVDIAAGLVASGAGVIALGVIAQALERIARILTERQAEPAALQVSPAERSALERSGSDRPATDRPVQDRPAMTPAARPAAPAAKPAAPPAAAVEPPKAVPEPVRPPQEPVRPPQEPVRPAAEPAAPTLVREGVIEGRRYRFFSDGSIEAEGPRGVRRYRSIDEAREQILRDRDREEKPINDSPEPPPEAATPARRAPEPPRLPRFPLEPLQDDERPIVPPAVRAKPAAGPVTWDSYLSGGPAEPGAERAPLPPFDAPPFDKPAPKPRAPDDDEWSEPFRMLLKGDGSENAPDSSKPRKR